MVRAQIRTVIRTRSSYGARRVRALVNRSFETSYNLKRIQRVMAINGWTLPRSTRRRTGRAHRGRVQRAVSNERWCSDVLEIACWNGEIVQVGFALDCHDREVLAHVAVPRDFLGTDVQRLMQRAVAARFGSGERPNQPIQWLSDNGSVYTALDTIITAERLNLVPITTPASSPESNGMSEAFVNTMRRDYFAGADLSSSAAVLDQLPALVRRLQCRRASFGARLSVTPALPLRQAHGGSQVLTRTASRNGVHSSGNMDGWAILRVICYTRVIGRTPVWFESYSAVLRDVYSSSEPAEERTLSQPRKSASPSPRSRSCRAWSDVHTA